MEIEVTEIVRLHLEHNPRAFFCSGSIMEHGMNAGEITWRNSCEVSERLNVCDTEEKREAIRDHIREYGAWEDEEIDGYTDIELGAFVVQETMSEIRRLEEHEGIDLTCFTEEEFMDATENTGGRLYPGSPEFVNNDRWFFYIGS